MLYSIEKNITFKERIVQPKLLSVVIPLLNEQDNLIPLYNELCRELAPLSYFKELEFLFINDGSTDASLSILHDLGFKDSRVKVISFVRNFGHESATYAGITHATGEAVVLIDADRQDPPSLILEFEKAYLQGIDIAYGQRSKRLNETWLKKLTSKWFYRVFKTLTRIDMPYDVGDFCMLSSKAVSCFKQLPERAIFIRGLIYWSGLAKQAIPFIRRSREAGITKYNYSKLTIFALENIISFSTTPIYLMLFASLGVIGLCAIGALTALGLHCAGKVMMTGWTSLILCILFSFASLTFCLSILGLYIGKIFQEIKQRPVFLIDHTVNMQTQNAAIKNSINQHVMF